MWSESLKNYSAAQIALVFLSISAMGWLVTTYQDPYSQMAAATAATGKKGICEQEYQQCTGKSKTKDNSECETKWKKCILETKKCAEIIETKSSRQCSADPECQTSCTEWATTKYGLKECCFRGPRRNNKCPQFIGDTYEKEECISDITTARKKYFPGPIFGDDNKKIPPKNLEQPETHLRGAIHPDLLLGRYPEGTVFNERDMMPSNAPMLNTQDPKLTIIPPGDPYSLPKEYQSQFPYIPSINEEQRINIRDTEGTIYSLRTDNMNKQTLNYLLRNNMDINERLAQETFGQPRVAPPPAAPRTFMQRFWDGLIRR